MTFGSCRGLYQTDVQPSARHDTRRCPGPWARSARAGPQLHGMPGHDHPARPPRIAVTARIRIVPPVRARDLVHAPIRTRDRAVSLGFQCAGLREPGMETAAGGATPGAPNPGNRLHTTDTTAISLRCSTPGVQRQPQRGRPNKDATVARQPGDRGAMLVLGVTCWSA